MAKVVDSNEFQRDVIGGNGTILVDLSLLS